MEPAVVGEEADAARHDGAQWWQGGLQQTAVDSDSYFGTGVKGGGWGAVQSWKNNGVGWAHLGSGHGGSDNLKYDEEQQARLRKLVTQLRAEEEDARRARGGQKAPGERRRKRGRSVTFGTVEKRELGRGGSSGMRSMGERDLVDRARGRAV
jgi:hypothetical protein